MKFAFQLLLSFLFGDVSHPNIIAYKEAFFEDTTSSLCIVMEFADGGDLMAKINDHIKKRTTFPEEELWKLLVEMTSGLRALHDLKILHRDIKVIIYYIQCANVFLTKKGHVKLGDLNVSTIAQK